MGARVSGERTVEERDEFNRKVEQLDRQGEEQKSLHAILTAQIKRQDAELKNSQRNLNGIKVETENMKGMMEELELQNTIVNRTVQNTVKEKEEALMQHDILRLEVKRLRQQLNTKSESLYSLENRKQQLQISMEEREKEIEVHTEVLKAQLRGAEEERHKAAIELAERKQKIYNLKSKYENVANKVKKEDGEEQHSQAHYMIKAAQEKEELQRKGDELDDKIRRAEREIRSLENTLGHLVTRNQKYKENFQTANQQNQSELEEKHMLEEQARAANEVLFKKKKVLAQLEREEQEDVKRFEELQANLPWRVLDGSACGRSEVGRRRVQLLLRRHLEVPRCILQARHTECVLEGHPSIGGSGRHKVWGHRGSGGSKNVGCRVLIKHVYLGAGAASSGLAGSSVSLRRNIAVSLAAPAERPGITDGSSTAGIAHVARLARCPLSGEEDSFEKTHAAIRASVYTC